MAYNCRERFQNLMALLRSKGFSKPKIKISKRQDGLIRSNIPFSNGEISLDVNLTDIYTEFSLVLGYGSHPVCFSLASETSAYSLRTWNYQTNNFTQ